MAVIPFFKTTITGNESEYVNQVLHSSDSIAQKEFTTKCENWFAENHGVKNFFLTKSCTHSLELAALVLDIQPGDEVIMPSFAFVSCANAFALRGAKCVFVNVHPDTMNIDESDLEEAITSKTKAIVTINYASVACNYSAIKAIASKHGLYVVEDNAHGIGAKHNGEYLGTFGDISTFSFDHLKNITCIQGGGIAVNNEQLLEKFYVAYEFGTNRRSFFKGNASRYEWKGLGSNFPLAELNAAMLYSQVREIETINDKFVSLWNKYSLGLQKLSRVGEFMLPSKIEGSLHNGHCFFIKAIDKDDKKELLKYLQINEIGAQFHYTGLHSSEFGLRNNRITEACKRDGDYQCLIRLPLYYELSESNLYRVIETIEQFYK